METNITNWQRKQNQNSNYSAVIPYDLEQQRKESREFLNDLVARDQRMIPALITLVHTAETKEQLDADTESIMTCARKHLCSLSILRWQQLEGLSTVLPFGGTKIETRRTLTTESLAVFIPFRVQDVCHKVISHFGNEFYNELITKLTECSEKWMLNSIKQIDYYSVNCIFKCVSQVYRPCVLKIVSPCREVQTEYVRFKEYG